MATPTAPSRRYYAMASNEAATWGTATAVGANDGILALDDGGFKRVQEYEQNPAIDQIVAKSGILGLIGPCDFSPTVSLQYEMGAWGSWLAALFGTEATNNTANCITHTFTWADSVTDFFSVVQERPGKIWECPAAMPYKLVIKPDGSKISAVMSLRGNTVKDDSSVNTATQVDAVTYVSRANWVNFTQGSFLFNAAGGADFNSTTDAVQVSDFELSLERAIDGQHILGSTVIAEPKEGAMPKLSLKLTLPRASSTNLGYFSNFTGETAFKGKLSFTGGVIANANNATTEFTFMFPRLVLKRVPDAPLEDIIKTGLEFEVEESSAAENGMSSNRVYCIVKNAATANYLS